MPTVTAIREDRRRGRVAVELDGTPWRVLPVDVVARAGLAYGRTLDRPALRLLRRELRRAEALGIAGRTLRTRDLSRRRLTERLERSRVAPAVAEASVAALEGAGLVDDRRAAEARARGLAERGWGDEAIRQRLAAEGFAAEAAQEAVATVEPEAERAARLVQLRGPGPKTARYLAGRGYGEEAVEAVLEGRFGQEA